MAGSALAPPTPLDSESVLLLRYLLPQLCVPCKPEKLHGLHFIHSTDDATPQSPRVGHHCPCTPDRQPSVIPHPVGSADTWNPTGNHRTGLPTHPHPSAQPPAPGSLPCPGSYTTACWHLWPSNPSPRPHPLWAGVLACAMVKIHLPVSLPGVGGGGTGSPGTKSGQWLWEFAGSEHPPPCICGFFSPTPSAPGASAHLFHSLFLPSAGRSTAEQACGRKQGKWENALLGEGELGDGLQAPSHRPGTPPPMTGLRPTTSQDHAPPPSSQPWKVRTVIIVPILQVKTLGLGRCGPWLSPAPAESAS